MKLTDKKPKFCVVTSYNLEEDSAVKALDKVLGMSPITPISFSVDPIEECEEGDDD